MAARRTGKTPPRPTGKAPGKGRRRLLSLESVPSKLKNRWIIFFLLALILTSMWYGPYVVSSDVGRSDTDKELYYFDYFRQNIRAGNLPFFFVTPPRSLAWYPAMLISHAAFANPEVCSFSPTMLLMLFLPLVAFLKAHFAIHFLLGIFGIYLLSKRLDLRLEFALGLLVLVLLNPWFLQHIAIGYSPWINAAFFPLMAALLIPRAKGKYDICWAALINALMLYQGGLHPFVWFNSTALLVVLLYSAKCRTVRPLIRIFAFYCVTVFAALPKLVMTGAIWGGMKQDIHITYHSFEGLWALLTDCTKDPYGSAEVEGFYNVAWYDGSLYMGVFFIVLVALSVVVALYREKWRVAFNELLIPAIIMVIISWGTNWNAVVSTFERTTNLILGKPMWTLRAERYPWRFLFLGVVLISGFAMIQLSRFVAGIKRRRVRVVLSCTAWVLLALIANNLRARNNYFAKIATSRSPTWVDKWDFIKAMDQAPVLTMNQRQIRVKWPDGSINPNRIEIPAQWFAKEGAIVLPWLKRKDATLFHTENCDLDMLTFPKRPASAGKRGPDAWLATNREMTVVRIRDRTKNVVLTYNKNVFWGCMLIGPLAVAGSFVIANVAGRRKIRILAASTDAPNS